MAEKEALAAVISLLAVNAVQIVTPEQRHLSNIVRAVFYEGHLPTMIPIATRVIWKGDLYLMMKEVVMKSAQEKNSFPMVAEGFLRAFSNVGLA